MLDQRRFSAPGASDHRGPRPSRKKRVDAVQYEGRLGRGGIEAEGQVPNLQKGQELGDGRPIFVEPSAAAGFPGCVLTQGDGEYAAGFGEEALKNAVHIVWATGGGMVPEEERRRYLAVR